MICEPVGQLCRHVSCAHVGWVCDDNGVVVRENPSLSDDAARSLDRVCLQHVAAVIELADMLF